VQAHAQAAAQVGARLARTEARSVAAAVSHTVGLLVQVGYLKPGRSSHDPNLQFDATVRLRKFILCWSYEYKTPLTDAHRGRSPLTYQPLLPAPSSVADWAGFGVCLQIVSPAAAAIASQAEVDADPSNALAPLPATTETAEGTAAAVHGTPAEEAAAAAPKVHPAAAAAGAKVTFSTPVNLREVEASLVRVRSDVEACVASVEDCDANVKACVTHAELDHALDLESEEYVSVCD
jgi:hypothetical protein